MKLSLIFILTIKPESINKARPEEARKSNRGLIKRPTNKPSEPISCKKPVSFLKLGNPYLSNSKMINFE